MREDFFVDYIDTVRLPDAPVRLGLVAVGNAGLEHRLGKFSACWGVLSVSTAIRFSPVSYLSQPDTRLAAYGLRQPAFFAFEAVSIAIDLAKLILFEDDKLEKLGALVAGCYMPYSDGVTTGRCARWYARDQRSRFSNH